jgi:O-antigen/teichoic acid export membrane protein
MGLDERIAITFAQGGVPPIMSRLERYYETKPERLQAIKAIFGTLATLALATAVAIMTTIFLQRVTL